MKGIQELYESKMEEIQKYNLQQINSQLREFLDVFPHNTMTIKKEKANKAAYLASTVLYENYPAVREACNEVENSLYLACNDVFIPTLTDEIARLQLSLESLLEACKEAMKNVHNKEYLKYMPDILKKPKDLVGYFVQDLDSMVFVEDLDRKSVFDSYKQRLEVIGNE